MRTHPSPPEMGRGRAVYRRLPDRETNDAKNPKRNRVTKKIHPATFFAGTGGVTLFTNRLVAVRYALSSSEWDFIRRVASAQGRWL